MHKIGLSLFRLCFTKNINIDKYRARVSKHNCAKFPLRVFQYLNYYFNKQQATILSSFRYGKKWWEEDYTEILLEFVFAQYQLSNSESTSLKASETKISLITDWRK